MRINGGDTMLTLTPVTLAAANTFVNAHHRHHKATAGHKFSIGCAKDGELVGVAIVGRPVSRYLIMAIVADFVAGAGQYKSKKLNSLSYILFSLGGTGSYIVFFVDPNGWAQTMLGNGTEQSYIDTMQATANTGILIAMFAAAIITSAISAFVGCKMLKKQFEKAGITA